MNDIQIKIRNLFDHPGVLLFRGRELPVVQKFFEKNHLPGQKRMIDIGCGEGKVGTMLFNSVDVGLEPVESDAAAARKTGVYTEVVVGDARQISFPNESFDIVFSNSVLEHIDGLEKVFSEFNRILKKDGILIYTSPTKYFAQYLSLAFVPFYSKYRNKQLSHYNLFTSNEAKETLKKYNLDVFYSEYYLPKNEIFIWDFMCLTLRLTSWMYPLHQFLKQKYFTKVENILSKTDSAINQGGSMLIAARKL